MTLVRFFIGIDLFPLAYALDVCILVPVEPVLPIEMLRFPYLDFILLPL